MTTRKILVSETHRAFEHPSPNETVAEIRQRKTWSTGRVRKRIQAFVGAAALLLNVSCLHICGRDYVVRLASDEEVLPSPRFLIESDNSNDAASKYDTVSVCEIDYRPDAGCPWRISAPPLDAYSEPRPHQLTYGEAPPGFSPVVRPGENPGPLLPNHKYLFTVSGPTSDQGLLSFHVTEDGRVLEGTAPIQGDAGR